MGFVVHIVLAAGFAHGQAFHLLEGVGIVHDDGAVLFPDGQQGVAAILGEFHVCGGFTRFRLQSVGDLQRAFVDQVYHIFIGAEEHVHPGIGAVVVTAHEEPGPQGVDLLDHLPVAHIDDGDLAFFQVGRGHDGFALVLPADAGAQVRHAGQGDGGDSPAVVQIYHLAPVPFTAGADQVVVFLVEKEIIQIGFRGNDQGGKGFAVGDFQDGFAVLEGGHETVAGRGGIDGTDPAFHRNDFDGGEVFRVQ